MAYRILFRNQWRFDAYTIMFVSCTAELTVIAYRSYCEVLEGCGQSHQVHLRLKCLNGESRPKSPLSSCVTEVFSSGTRIHLDLHK